MKNNYTEERKELLRQYQTERKGLWSQESIEKLRQIALNRPVDYLSEEGKAKISEASSRIVSLYKLDNSFMCQFKQITDASNYLNCSYKTIQRALTQGHIYIPASFEIYLNNDYISNNKSLPMDIIELEQLNIIKSNPALPGRFPGGETKKYRIYNGGSNLQAGLKDLHCFNRYLIK